MKHVHHAFNFLAHTLHMERKVRGAELNSREEMAPVTEAAPQSPSARPSRRLKPGVAAKFAAAQTMGAEIRELYDRPVEQLSPEEIALMRAAFFRG
jgi:hypothetical protein